MERQKEIARTANGERGEAGLGGRARCGLKEPSPGGQVYPAYLPPHTPHAPGPCCRRSPTPPGDSSAPQPALAPPPGVPFAQGPHAALSTWRRPTAPTLLWWGSEMAALSPRRGSRALGARSRLWAAPPGSDFQGQPGQGSVTPSSREHRCGHGRSCEPAPALVCASRTGRARILGHLNRGIVY